MLPTESILVFQDSYSESVQAIGFAANAAQMGPVSKIKIMDIQPPVTAFWYDLIDDDFEESPAYHRQKSLRELVRGFKYGEAEVKTQVKTGRAVNQIIEAAVEGDFRMIVKCAQSEVGEYLFGSVDMRLIRYSPVPVMILHPEVQPPPQRILVALNPEAEGDEIALNEKLLAAANELANLYDCKLGVVAACSVAAPVFGHMADRDMMARLEGREKALRKKCREEIGQMVEDCDHPILAKDVYVDSGRPSEVILSAVEDFEPELLVIGSIARQGLAGLLVGNTAERVLRSVDCSVLTIKPDGFESPFV
jgi:nucleotide-binding universal stress UspA family protein